MTGELRRGAPIRGVTGGTTEGTITTGGFTYDEATLEGLVKEWLDLAEDYNRSFRDSQRLAGVKGPGLDFASAAVAEAANSYGQSYLTYLRQNRQYCADQAQLYQNALDDYLGVDDETSRTCTTRDSRKKKTRSRGSSRVYPCVEVVGCAGRRNRRDGVCQHH